MQFDVIIVGGSYSGISAALQIARGRRSVMVVDAGQRRNRFAHASHGFLGQDGRPAAAIVEDARAQLMAYPTVTWLSGHAESAARTAHGFTVSVDGQVHEARRLVLATGVVDELPDIPGLAERWGKSVFHCPYCHGYELDNGRVGVLATAPASMHQALMLPDWGTTTMFLDAAFTPDGEQLESLRKRKVTIEREPVAAVSGERADVRLRDGRTISLDGLFVLARTRVSTPLAEQLGCALEEGPVGFHIQTGPTKETTVAGVFACGDAARQSGSVALAVGEGAMAGVAAHQSLMFRED